MSIGQIAEIATMADLGFFLKTTRLANDDDPRRPRPCRPVRDLLARRQGPSLLWLVILSNVVHGFAYAFFFATVYIFVDENFPQGRAHQCPEPVQPADPGPRAAGRATSSGAGSATVFTDPATEEVDYHQLFLVPARDWACWPRRSWRSSSIPRRKIRFPKRFPSLSIKSRGVAHARRRLGGCCVAAYRRPPRSPWPTTSWRGT